MKNIICLVLSAAAVFAAFPSAEACSVATNLWPWDEAYLRRIWAETVAQNPDELVFAGKVIGTTEAPDLARKHDADRAELVEFDVVGVMRGSVPRRVKLLRLFREGCGSDWDTAPVGKLSFVMARREEESSQFQATILAVDSDALSLLIAFTNAGMRAKSPK